MGAKACVQAMEKKLIALFKKITRRDEVRQHFKSQGARAERSPFQLRSTNHQLPFLDYHLYRMCDDRTPNYVFCVGILEGNRGCGGFQLRYKDVSKPTLADYIYFDNYGRLIVLLLIKLLNACCTCDLTSTGWSG